MKLSVLSFYSRLISFLLALLGFTACDFGGAEYGTPNAKFIVKGVLIDKQANSETISGVKVALGYSYTDKDGNKSTYYIDSIVTNNTGKFNVAIWDFPSPRKFVIKYEDTYVSQNGNYGLTVDTIHFESPEFTDGDGHWYSGEATVDLGSIELDKK